MNGIKTYGNSYLYTKVPDYEKKILEYVMKADRIDKHSEVFSGIIEDVKRRQSSAVLSRVLMREDVVLAVYPKALPAAFKVFACKDVRTDNTVKVFIDCSGLLTMKNGFYVANKIDVLCTYLMAAMTMIVYNTETMRIVTNSSIIQSGTECFVSLASHIFDYFRPNGYAENKNKIAYILGMYFQVNLLGLGKEDNSTKNLSAKIAGVQMRDINAMEMYYEAEDLENIDTLITSLADTFKMRGIDTSVFIEKWTWFYGVGTQFASELFTAFAKMITDAYCGSYINNQKTIEKCCGRSMVNFSNAILRIGQDSIDQGFRYESAMDRDSRSTIVNEFLNLDRHQVTKKMTKDDYKDSEKLKEAMDSISSLSDKKKQSDACYKALYGGSVMCDEYILDRESNYPNFMSTISKDCAKYCNSKDKEKCINLCQKIVTNMTKMIGEKNEVIKNMNDSKKILSDTKKALKIFDPKNPLVESYIDTDSIVDSLHENGIGFQAYKDLQGQLGNVDEFGYLNENTLFSYKHYQKDMPKEAKFNTLDLFNMDENKVKSTINKSMSHIENPKVKSNYALAIIKDVMNSSGKNNITDIRDNKQVNSIWVACRKYLTDKDVEAAKKIMTTKKALKNATSGGVTVKVI